MSSMKSRFLSLPSGIKSRTVIRNRLVFTFCLAFSVISLAYCIVGQQQSHAKSPEVSFNKDIAPILFNSCESCHRPGGSAPFSLLKYRDVKLRARLIVDVTERRYMPPWLPERGHTKFVDERGLKDSEIATIRQWYESGAPEGNPSDLPVAPQRSSDWELGPPDLVIKAPSYTVQASAPELYRNLVIRRPLSQPRYIEVVDLRPGHPSVVHHAKMMVDTTDSSRRYDTLDAEPGFDGMRVFSNARNPEGHFVGWTPGQVATRSSGAFAWKLDARTDLILQLHLRPLDENVTVHPEIALYFAKEPPKQAPALIMLGTKIIDIPAGATDYTVVDTYTLPVEVQVLSIYPHAHYLAKEMQCFATLPNGEKRWLIHIKDWDFNWQDDYRYQQPIPLPVGSTLTMRYTFDNSASNPQNPNQPPKRVVYGSKSSDEMAELLIQVLPKNEKEGEIFRRDVAWKDEARDIAYLAHDQYAQGKEFAAKGELDKAIRHYQQALQYHANDVNILTSMAGAFFGKGDFESVIFVGEHTDKLSQYSNAALLDVLAAAYASAGKMDMAIATAERAVAAASSSGNFDFAKEIRMHIKSYKRGNY